MRGLFITLVWAAMFPAISEAHEMRPGYLEINETSPGNYDVLWKVPAAGTNMRLGLDVRFADDVEIVTGSSLLELGRKRRPGRPRDVARLGC